MKRLLLFMLAVFAVLLLAGVPRLVPVVLRDQRIMETKQKNQKKRKK
ncbi:hypothetical protein ACI2OX_03945 [Bacillus sp. N9]